MSLVEIDASDHLLTEQHLPLRIGLWHRSQRDRQATEGLADPQGMTAVEDPTTGADRANLEIRRIVDGRQALRKPDRTGTITAGGSVELQRVMRPAQIITVTKNIKLALAVLKSSEIKVTQNFELKCAMNRSSLP